MGLNFICHGIYLELQSRPTREVIFDLQSAIRALIKDFPNSRWFCTYESVILASVPCNVLSRLCTASSVPSGYALADVPVRLHIRCNGVLPIFKVSKTPWVGLSSSLSSSIAALGAAWRKGPPQSHGRIDCTSCGCLWRAEAVL